MLLWTLKNHITQPHKPVWPSSKSNKNINQHVSATFCFQTDLKRRGAAPCLFQVAQFNRNVNENRGEGEMGERGGAERCFSVKGFRIQSHQVAP